MAQDKQIILTGDRTTGPLHLGHYVGSLRSRLELQDRPDHEQFLLLADMQALTDNAYDPGKVTRSIVEVATDYLAVGIDPAKSRICLQSQLPALAELTQIYMNFAKMGHLERNPTVREEIRARGFGDSIPAGFFCYPVAQAADITAFKATLVPVGADQAPMMEINRYITRQINRTAGRDILPEAREIIPEAGRLPGADGKSKMSKSSGNAITFSSTPDEIRKAVRAMYTDPNHIRVEDPGQVEGNVVFTYLDAFDPDQAGLEELKARYRRGGLGDGQVKRRLTEILEELVSPIRARRAELAKDPGYVMDVVRQGTEVARARTEATKREVVEGLGIFPGF